MSSREFERVSDVVEAALHAVRFLRIGEIVALVRAGQPHAGFVAEIEQDLFGQAEAEPLLEEFAIGLDVNREAVEMIEPPHVDAARETLLGLILQRGLQVVRRLIPVGVVIEFDHVPVGITEAIGGPWPNSSSSTDPEVELFNRSDASSDA